jgi:hypothetical protein
MFSTERSGEPTLSEVEWGSAVLQAHRGIFFEEAVWALRPVEPIAQRQPSSAKAGASPTPSERRKRGTLSPDPASVLGIRKTVPRRACRSLGFARDDKGKSGVFPSNWSLVERTAGPSTSLRSGRDDNSYFGEDARAQEKSSF